MMLSEFIQAPTNQRHEAYSDSMLSGTAPEYSTGEVLLASAYRRLILGVGENAVDLDQIAKTAEKMPAAVGGAQLWSRLLMDRGGLMSPFRHGQHSPTSSRQLMPIVPSIALVAGVLGRRPRNRWNPSNLLLEVIGTGTDVFSGERLVKDLGESLSVTATDDLFAQFAENALEQALEDLLPNPRPSPVPFQSITLDDKSRRGFRANAFATRLCPAERFCRDLREVISLKSALTRRQWSVLVEAILRLGLGMHVLWMCKVNDVVWNAALAVLSGANPPTISEIEAAAWEQQNESQMLLQLGSDSEPLIERLIERYAFARTGLNILLCRLSDVGAPWSTTSPLGFDPATFNGAPHALAGFLAHAFTHRLQIDSNPAGWLRTQVGELFETETLRKLARRKAGYTKNLFEFARHSLGQIKAKDPAERCYDLSYLLAYSGDRKPLPVQPGPDMLVMLVHVCCAANPSIPVSLDDFRRHLGEYGFNVPAGELGEGKTGRDLAMLGLVVDSPDAAGGRLLVQPFA